MTYIKILAALAVIAIVYFGWQTYANAIAESERLTGELTKANNAAAAWQKKSEDAEKEIKKRDAAIVERDERRNAIAGKLSNALAEIEKLKHVDPTVRAWSNQPLPAAIAARLRGDSPRTAPVTVMPNSSGDAHTGNAETAPSR